MIIGTVVTTIHGNKLRRFENGWSPLSGAHWDRWTVYTDEELDANFSLVCNDCGHSESAHGDGSGRGCYICGCLT